VDLGGGRRQEAGVNIGDVVLYAKRPISALEIEVDGERCLLMRPIDILGVLDEQGQ
jgi:co-chaperonin GroES (HSP10)